MAELDTTNVGTMAVSGPSNPAALDQDPNAPDQLLSELEKDFNRLKRQKARPTGGVEGSLLLNLCFLNDEQYVVYKAKQLSLEPRDANKLYLTFNLIAPRFHKLQGRLSAFNAPFKARSDKKDPQAWEEVEIVDKLIRALDEKVDEPSRMRERIYWLLLGGTAFEYVPWIPDSTIELKPQFGPGPAGPMELLFIDLEARAMDPASPPVPQSVVQQMIAAGRPKESFEIYEEVEEVGEVGSEILGPFNVFIDHTVRSVADLPPDGWVHIARPKTIGWIQKNFPDAGEVTPQKDISLVSSKILIEGESTGGVFLKDLIPLIQGACDENDPPLVVFVESYQPASPDFPRGQYVCWVPGQKVLAKAANPYEEIPLVDYHFGAVSTSFWTKSYVGPLISPQRFINKRMSQLGEQANAAVYSAILLAAGLTEADIPADFPGVIKNGLNENGEPNVGRLPGPELPMWFLPSIQLAVSMFNDAAGGLDLMEQNKFPGQLRGPMAVPMLQEILDTQWGPLFQHLGERIARVKQMRLNRVKQFYPPVRTMHYVGRDQREEVMEFMTDKILRSGTQYSVTVERGSILPELRALREARVSERLSGPLAILYMDERTGRLDKSKIAADLAFGDTGREDREAKYRKLSQEFIKMLWEGVQPPPVQPFYDHSSMLDELEDSMTSMDFIKASPQIQQLFQNQYAQHMNFLMQQAQQQQQAMQGQMIHTAVAQATQQAAAQAAAEAVHQAMTQVHAQQALPTGQMVQQADQQAGNQPFPTMPPPSGPHGMGR